MLGKQGQDRLEGHRAHAAGEDDARDQGGSRGQAPEIRQDHALQASRWSAAPRRARSMCTASSSPWPARPSKPMPRRRARARRRGCASMPAFPAPISTISSRTFGAETKEITGKVSARLALDATASTARRGPVPRPRQRLRHDRRPGLARCPREGLGRSPHASSARARACPRSDACWASPRSRTAWRRSRR